MGYRGLKIASTDPSPNIPAIEVIHQSNEAGLRFLSCHGGSFNVTDFFEGGVSIGKSAYDLDKYLGAEESEELLGNSASKKTVSNSDYA